VMSPSATPLRSARPARPSPQGRVAEGPHGVMPEGTGVEPYTPCLLAEAGSHETRAPRVPARVLVACSRGRDTRMARASPAVRAGGTGYSPCQPTGYLCLPEGSAKVDTRITRKWDRAHRRQSTRPTFVIATGATGAPESGRPGRRRGRGAGIR